MERIIRTALELGFAYAPVALSLFLSYRILDIADLTTDGCFVLGAAVSVRMAAAGHPVLGMLLAIPAGALCGLVSAELQTRFGIPSILAGIITNTGLYSINLMVMGWRSNINLIREDSIFSLFRKMIPGNYSDLVLLAAIPVMIALFLSYFMHTRLGLSIRATGDNPVMVRASSIDTSSMIRTGLMLSGIMTAVSGAAVGQFQKTTDINSGTGVVVIGLACLIMGETVLGRRSVRKGIAGALLGSVIYRFIYAFVFYTQLVPVQCLKLLTAFIVAVSIAVPHVREQRIQPRPAQKEEEGNDA
ncbi:MAG: ABC transporter permease [Oscillospiraceae bacterium]|jgi:putative ABC transport system permease protein|nr:ABC transporter permease [Oscillospiraceae bacterium]